MESIEIWKSLDIKGFEKYQISSFGRVKNSNTNKILKQQKNVYGYMCIMLWEYNGIDKAKPRRFQVHRLVLHVFKPNKNESLLTVNHIDFDRSNNKLDNLEWTTQKENANKKKPKQKYYNSKGCFDDKGNFFNSFREAGRFYNISPNTIKRDCLGLTTKIEKYKDRSARPTFHF